MKKPVAVNETGFSLFSQIHLLDTRLNSTRWAVLYTSTDGPPTKPLLTPNLRRVVAPRMVYCGVLSKGCERCRKRRIKACYYLDMRNSRHMHMQGTPRLTISLFEQCDQRKPGCLKCEKSRHHCPGYRDLHQVLFRDESERVRHKAYQNHLTQSDPAPGVVREGDLVQAFETLHSATALITSNPSCGLSHSLGELGMNFFFTRYTFDQPPFSDGYSQWLTQSCFGHGPNHALQAAIEAVGTAALANVFHAPSAAAKSKKQYSLALMATKKALNSPTQALADETMMAIILLGLFEVHLKDPIIP